MNTEYDIKKLESAFSEDFSSSLYAILANEYLQNKELNRAHTVCKIGLEHHPDDITGQFILAQTYLLKNNISEAKSLLNKILMQFPLHVNARKLIIEIFKNEKNKNKLDYHRKQLLEFSPINFVEKKESKPAKKPTAKKVLANKPVVRKASSPKTPNPSRSIKQPFIIDKKMATFTLVSILVKQKHFQEALKVLDMLDKAGKDKKKIKQKRNSIKKKMSE